MSKTVICSSVLSCQIKEAVILIKNILRGSLTSTTRLECALDEKLSPQQRAKHKNDSKKQKSLIKIDNKLPCSCKSCHYVNYRHRWTASRTNQSAWQERPVTQGTSISSSQII